MQANIQNVTNKKPPTIPVVRTVVTLLYFNAIAGSHYALTAKYRFK
jgi:hypothetical protein